MLAVAACCSSGPEQQRASHTAVVNRHEVHLEYLHSSSHFIQLCRTYSTTCPPNSLLVQAVMEADQEKLRLEAEAEVLAEEEMTPEVEARLVRRHGADCPTAPTARSGCHQDSAQQYINSSCSEGAGDTEGSMQQLYMMCGIDAAATQF